MQERFETFTVLINRISRNIRKLKNQEMAEYHLRSAHISCLYYLYSRPAITAGELCECCQEDKATVSRALEHLQTNGYLVYEAERKYKCPILLTEKGKQVGERLAIKIRGILEEVGRAMTDAERAGFYQSLAAVSDDLDRLVRNRETPPDRT